MRQGLNVLKSFSVLLLLGTSSLSYASAPLVEEVEKAASSFTSSRSFQIVQGLSEVSQHHGRLTIKPLTSLLQLQWQHCPEGDVTVEGESVVLNTFLEPCTLGGAWRSSGTLVFEGKELTLDKKAVVEAASLLLNSHPLKLEGKTWQVLQSDSLGKLINHGSLKVAAGGFVGMVGSEVINQGTITAPQGHIIVAAVKEALFFVGNQTLITRVTPEGEGKIRLSGTLEVQGAEGRGGTITVLGKIFTLTNASLDASGSTQGGSILLGGTPPHQEQGVSSLKAETLEIDEGSTLKASSQEGKGGRVVLWSERLTDFKGTIDAQGKSDSTLGGFVEVSGKNGLVVKGEIKAGRGGEVVFDPKNIIITSTIPAPSGGSSTPSFNATAFADPHPGPENHFGRQVFVLPSGRFLVFSDYQSGAVYLYDAVGTLLGETIVPRSDGHLGSGGITLLDNDKVVVCSPTYDSKRGLVLLIDGITGARLQAIMGDALGDQICSDGIISLGSRYLIVSPAYASQKGIVTAVDATQTFDTKAVSQLGGLKGDTADDQVGGGGVLALKEGIVICSPAFAKGKGAVTWLSSSQLNTLHRVNSTNSLIGSFAGNKEDGLPGDSVGSGGVLAFPIVSPSDHNKFAVLSPLWSGTFSEGDQMFFKDTDNRKGAITLCQASSCTGEISIQNSFIGTARTQRIGDRGGVVLSNDCIAIKSRLADNRGAITKLCYSKTSTGEFDKTNSLMGERKDDRVGREVYALASGGMLITSPYYHQERGALTKFKASETPTRFLNATNSLFGQNPGDMVGNGGCITFQDDSWACSSFNYGGFKGAVTQGGPTTPTTGNITSSNSFIGAKRLDMVGLNLQKLDETAFIVQSQMDERGGVTYIEKANPLYGEISPQNSLIGNRTGDYLGYGGISCPDLYCTVLSKFWRGYQGMLLLVDRTANSFRNDNPNLKNLTGDQVMRTRTVSSDDPALHISFEKEPYSMEMEGVPALGSHGITVIPSSGDRLLFSGHAFNDVGLISSLNVTNFPTSLNTNNSFMGTKPGDRVGNKQAVMVGNTAYALVIPGYNKEQGMVVYDYQTNPITSDSTTFFNITGTTAGASKNLSVYPVSPNGTFLVSFPYDDNGFGIESGRLILVMPAQTVGSGGIPPIVLNGSSTFNDYSNETTYITPTTIANLLNFGTTVTLQASNDILVNDPIMAFSSPDPVYLTLKAGRALNINANIVMNLGNIQAWANTPTSQGVVTAYRETGLGGIIMASGTQITLADSSNPRTTIEFQIRRAPEGGDIVLGNIQSYYTYCYNNAATKEILRSDNAAIIKSRVQLRIGSNLSGNIGSIIEPLILDAPFLNTIVGAGGIFISSIYSSPPIRCFIDPISGFTNGMIQNNLPFTPTFAYVNAPPACNPLP